MDSGDTKVFNDPIHGLIELHPLCVKIIDTPEFHRLRFLKQLGTTYFVYPAGRLVEAIKRRQPDLEITEKDVLCVKIAGLCHDLGHGPFSHLFDRRFLPKASPGTTWEHEQASIKLLDYMIKKRNLEPEFEKYGLDTNDIIFIKEQIWPEMWNVVANKRNGIDVDKWDYLARDCYMLGMQNNFDYNRCIHFARVLDVKGKLDVVKKQICTREKEAGHLYEMCYTRFMFYHRVYTILTRITFLQEAGHLYDMFYTRYMLHCRAYQHKTVCIIDMMITEALIKANEHIMFTGKNGEEKKMSEAIDDMKAYSKMTDNVIFLILNSNDENLAESKEILNNVMSRKLTYKYTTHSVANIDKMLEKEDINEAVKEIIAKKKTGHPDLKDTDITVKESSFLPKDFLEQQIRLYCKADASDDLEKSARYAFGEWCKAKGLPVPK
ncbi:SAMH1-like protein, partial [Mya arenaria]